MTLRKKCVLIAVSFPTVLLAILFNGLGDAPEAASATTEQTSGVEIDRLFRSMGIIKVPRIPPPAEISLADINGRMVHLSEFKGNIVLLNFWTTWCPDCRVEMPSLESLHKRLKNKDFVMVGINLQESAMQVKTFLKAHHLTFTVLLDAKGDVGSQFGIRAIPSTFILDKDGAIMAKAMGPRKWNSKKSIALFEHLINNTTQNENNNKHQQKKSISYHIIRSDTGTGNPAARSESAG